MNGTKSSDGAWLPARCSSDMGPRLEDMFAPRLPFRVRRDGVWLYRGKPVTRKTMLCLFASLLRRDAQGRYWLDMPGQAGVIEVDDVPFLAVEMDFKGGCARTQTVCFRTNTDELVCVGERHPLVRDWRRGGEAPAYLRLRDRPGEAPLFARVGRSAMFELAALATPERLNGQECLGVWSRGTFFPLTRTERQVSEQASSPFYGFCA